MAAARWDMQSRAACSHRVRFKRQISRLGSSVSLAISRDAILVMQHNATMVFNSTGTAVSVPKPVLEESLMQIAGCVLLPIVYCVVSAHCRMLAPRTAGLSALLRMERAESDVARDVRRYFGLEERYSSAQAPLAGANRESHSVLQLSDRVIAVYRRELHKPAAAEGFSVDWMRWARPLMLLGMVLFGSSYFVKAKGGMGMGAAGRYSGSMSNARRAEALMRAGVGGAGGSARVRAPAFGGVGAARTAGRGFGRVPRAAGMDEDVDLPPLYGQD